MARAIRSEIQSIVSRYRQERGLSLRGFSDALAVDGALVSHQAIADWENGVKTPNRVSLRFLEISTSAGDWRHQFALDMLAALESEAS